MGKLADGYMDCYRISENWPQAPLNRNPLSKIFGRHMLFFKCADKMERKMCAKAQMLKWLETIYGTDPSEDPSEYGLPKDKYDAEHTFLHQKVKSKGLKDSSTCKSERLAVL